MRLLVYTFLFIINALVCSGQDAASHIEQEITRLGAYFQDSVELMIPLADQLLLDDQILADSSHFIKVLKYKSRANRKLGNYAESIVGFKQLHHYAQYHKDSLLLAEAADQIGIMNTFMGNMIEGQRYLIEVARIYDKIGTLQDKANANNGLAIFYNDMEQYDKAIDMYNLALSQYESIDDTMGRANIHANLGLLYINIDSFELARQNLMKQGYLDTLLNTQWGLGFHYDFMGLLEEAQGNYQSSLEWYKQALETRVQLPSHYNIAESRAGYSKCLYKLGNYTEAIHQANLILKHKEDHQSLSQQSIAYSLLSRIYEKIGDSDQALSYYKEYKSMSDSIYQRDMLSEIADKDALYQRAKQEEKIAVLNAEKTLTENKLAHRHRIIALGGITMLIILGLLLGLYKSLKKIAIQKSEISENLKEKEILLREIHHRVKNNLQMVSSLLTMQGKSINDETALEAINDGKSRVKSMALIHQDLYNSDHLTGINAKTYLEKLTQELLTTYNIHDKQIALQLEIADLNIDVDTIIPLGLIINEIVTNSLKYAWPKHKQGEINVKLYLQDEQLCLFIKDNGIGYDVSKVANTSFGSTLVEALTQQLDGEMSVTNSNGTMSKFVFNEYKLR